MNTAKIYQVDFASKKLLSVDGVSTTKAELPVEAKPAKVHEAEIFHVDFKVKKLISKEVIVTLISEGAQTSADNNSALDSLFKEIPGDDGCYML
nr:hypothetical protein BdHM001_35900 [Bdellovibrio sp. HM001]